MNALYQYDMSIGSTVIIGIDEAGRGALAGPVVAAAVVLDLDNPIDGINDSKKLSAERRDILYDKIVSAARKYGVGIATAKEVDEINVLQATFLAMRRAVEIIGSGRDDLMLVDGNQYIAGLSRERQLRVIGGDALSASIAAASILAKVTRDRIMLEYHKNFPCYGFAENKGYGTKIHRIAIAKHGMCEIHRKTFCGNGTIQIELFDN